jgi:hypothetical protein
MTDIHDPDSNISATGGRDSEMADDDDAQLGGEILTLLFLAQLVAIGIGIGWAIWGWK